MGSAGIGGAEVPASITLVTALSGLSLADRPHVACSPHPQQSWRGASAETGKGRAFETHWFFKTSAY